MISISQVFIYKQMIWLISSCVSYLNKDFFLASFVCLILSQKTLDFDKYQQKFIF